MRTISIGDLLVSPAGKELTVIRWKPGSGLFAIGKWLLRDRKGVTCQLSTVELTKRGYYHSPH